MMTKRQTNLITIYTDNGCWVAFFEGPHAAGIKELFGTATIPLPFTDKAQPEIVKLHVQKRIAKNAKVLTLY